MQIDRKTYACDQCGDEYGADEKVFEYHGDYLCADCFCSRVLTREAYINFYCTEDTTEHLADALGYSTWFVSDILEDTGGIKG